jgi:hypothetical protein
VEDRSGWLTRDLALATQILLQLAVRDIGQLTDLFQAAATTGQGASAVPAHRDLPR